MNDVLIAILLIVILFPTIDSFVKIIKQRHYLLWIICGVLGIFISLITLFLLNRPSFIIPQQSEAIQYLSLIKNNKTKDKEYLFIRDNFVFIDNSFSNQLVTAPGNQLSNSNTVITNRTDLTHLFKCLLKADSLVDIIVCDIFFDLPTPEDTLLRHILAEPGIESKLLLGHNFLSPTIPFFASLNDSIYGNIVEAGTNNFFSTFHPVYERKPSLAYLLHKRFTNLTGKNNANRGLLLNPYIPEITLTNEKRLYPYPTDWEENKESVHQEAFSYRLGDFTNSFSKNNFIDYLIQRKKELKRNIIFIGALRDQNIDAHQTFTGKLQGATIILNLFLSLQKGQDRVSMGFIIYVWLCFSLILTILFCNALKIPIGHFIILHTKEYLGINSRIKQQDVHNRKKRRKTRSSQIQAYKETVKRNIKALVDLVIIDELHIWLLLIFIILTALLFDKIINGFALLILFTIIHKLLIYYEKEYTT